MPQQLEDLSRLGPQPTGWAQCEGHEGPRAADGTDGGLALLRLGQRCEGRTRVALDQRGVLLLLSARGSLPARGHASGAAAISGTLRS